MPKLILEPTVNAQWQTLVQEAESSSHVYLNDDLESYLIFLLVRFTDRPEVAKSVLCLDFLESLNTTGQQKTMLLRDVGDKCLLVAGLFPGRAQRKSVTLSYFVDIGRNAYGHLALASKRTVAELYEMIQQKFVTLMGVLQAIRALTAKAAGLTPLQAEELWASTKNQYALTLLKQYTGLSAITDYHSKIQH